jgi:hypothetical protein
MWIAGFLLPRVACLRRAEWETMARPPQQNNAMSKAQLIMQLGGVHLQNLPGSRLAVGIQGHHRL